MAFLRIDNVKLSSIASCVPPKQVENIHSDLIDARFVSFSLCPWSVI